MTLPIEPDATALDQWISEYASPSFKDEYDHYKSMLNDARRAAMFERVGLYQVGMVPSGIAERLGQTVEE